MTYIVVWFIFLLVVIAYVTQWRNHVMDLWDFGLSVVLTFFWPVTIFLAVCAVCIDELSNWVTK
jgi:hypothetical protein